MSLMAAQSVLLPDAMSEGARYDVSVILPFGDDEELVGIAIRRTAAHLRGLGLSFEILAVDEDSADNSHAVLALLRGEVPELRVTHASARGRGIDTGAGRAQGTLLVVATPDVAAASLDGVGDACRRLLRNEGDAEVALTKYTVAHRIRALAAFRGVRLLGASMHRRIVKRLQLHNLAVRVDGPTGVAAKSGFSLRAFARIG
jgi:hypothetical protein